MTNEDGDLKDEYKGWNSLGIEMLRQQLIILSIDLNMTRTKKGKQARAVSFVTLYRIHLVECEIYMNLH